MLSMVLVVQKQKKRPPNFELWGEGGGRGQVNSYGAQGAQVRRPASIRRLLAAAAGPVEPSGEYSLSPLARTFCALKKYYHQPDPTCFRQARVQVILFPNQGGGRGVCGAFSTIELPPKPATSSCGFFFWSLFKVPKVCGVSGNPRKI